MEQSFTRSVDSLDEVFSFVDEFLASAQLPEEAGFPVRFVTEELFTNLVKYNAASSALIRLEFRREGDTLYLEFIDVSDHPFDISDHPDVDVDRPLGERTPGGLGIHLTKHLVDDVRYSFDAGVSRTTLIKHLKDRHV